MPATSNPGVSEQQRARFTDHPSFFTRSRLVGRAAMEGKVFAADLFETGVDAAQVGQRLGFAQPVSAGRLCRAWKIWFDQQDVPAFSHPEPAAPPVRAEVRRGRSG
jgi:hypothetical protein